MADNTQIKNASNAPVTMATKDIGGVHHPKGILHDASGVAIAAATADPALNANGLVVRPIAQSDVVLTGPGAQSVINTDLLSGGVNGWYDVRAYRSATVQIIASAGIAAGAIIFEQTNDISLAPSGAGLPVREQATIGNSALFGAQTIAASTARMFSFPINAAYVRVRISTAFSGGTVQAVAVLSAAQVAPAVAQINQPTAANLNMTAGAGSNLVGDVGMQYRGSATGAALIKHIVAAAGTNAQNAKASAGRLLGWSLSNTTASWKYVKLHNNAGVPTAGASVVMTIGIPPNATVQAAYDGGIGFATGIALSITGGVADNDTTVVVAGDVVGDLFYA